MSSGASPREQVLLAPPQRLCLFGRLVVGVYLGVDLFGELGVVGESRLNKLAGKAEHFDHSGDPLGRRNVAAHEAFDDLPHVGAADQISTPSGGSVAEADQWMAAGS